jgi:hypothetical protein
MHLLKLVRDHNELCFVAEREPEILWLTVDGQRVG